MTPNCKPKWAPIWPGRQANYCACGRTWRPRPAAACTWVDRITFISSTRAVFTCGPMSPAIAGGSDPTGSRPTTTCSRWRPPSPRRSGRSAAGRFVTVLDNQQIIGLPGFPVRAGYRHRGSIMPQGFDRILVCRHIRRIDAEDDADGGGDGKGGEHGPGGDGGGEGVSGEELDGQGESDAHPD